MILPLQGVVVGRKGKKKKTAWDQNIAAVKAQALASRNWSGAGVQQGKTCCGEEQQGSTAIASGGGGTQQTESGKEQGANPAPPSGNALRSHNDLVSKNMESNGDSPT